VGAMPKPADSHICTVQQQAGEGGVAEGWSEGRPGQITEP